MRARRAVSLLALLALMACGKDAPEAAPAAPAGRAPKPPSDGGVIDRTSAELARQLPRAMTAADVEIVLRLTPLVEDEAMDYATAAGQAGVTLSESDWGNVSARVSMAYAQLLFAEEGVGDEIHAPLLKADIEVVRPFKGRLDRMHEARRAMEENAIDRSGNMVSLSAPEFISARCEVPGSWERFKEPNTDRDGFRVRAGAGEQFLAVRARGELGPKYRRYVLQPGGYYIEDAWGIVIRPKGGT